MGDNYFLLTNLLSEDERKVITSIASHIERGEKRVGIQQIASENFLSTTSIVKMCKRLGFDGYSELYYHLSRQLASSEEKKPEDLKSLIDNYDDTLITRFCALLMERRSGKVFTTGEGFSNIVGTYIMHRLAICGFKAFNNVHFYDYMVFQEARHGTMRDEAAVMFAISRVGKRSRCSTMCAMPNSMGINRDLYQTRRLHARPALRLGICDRRSKADTGGQPAESLLRARHSGVRGSDGALF